MRRTVIALTAALLLVMTPAYWWYRNTEYHLVASGKEGSQVWQIWASAERPGSQALCMKLTVVNSKADGNTDGAPPSPGACGFEDSPDSEGPVRTLEWDAVDGMSLVFGPVSEAAVKVRIYGDKTSPVVVASQPLPAHTVHGRWFLTRLPTTDDDAWDTTPLDAQGKSLPQTDF